MNVSTTDVVVIGGGPAGSATATLLADAGLRVALFDKGAFPRHHVGESLIPAVNLTLERLGLLDRMDGYRFPRKHGVQFFSPRGPSRPFYFSEAGDERMKASWQVLRSDFDQLVIERAQEAGVCANFESEVVDVLVDGPEDNEHICGVQVVEASGDMLDVEARVVIDASGVQGLLAQRLGERHHIDGLQNSSVYAHFEGVEVDHGLDGGSTLIFKIEHGAWLWFIPLPDAVSIGLVAPAKSITRYGRRPNEILSNAIASSEHLMPRMTNARQIGPTRAVRDFSYHAHCDGGRGWLLVGDALGFIDPMYSTGLFLSLLSAELGADAVSEKLRHHRGAGAPDFRGFSKRWQDAYDRFLPLVRAFYREDPRFREFARVPAKRQGLVDLLTGLFETPDAVAVADELQSPPDTATTRAV